MFDYNQLFIGPPSDLPAIVTGCNAYMNGPIDLQWRKQNATPISTANRTMPDATGILDYGLAPPARSSTPAFYTPAAPRRIGF